MRPYWLDTPLITGESSSLAIDKARQAADGRLGEIAVIGTGLSGVSVAYFLQKHGFSDITLIDDEPEKSASYRNCGHILHGAVESPLALDAIHGRQKAKEIWDYSVRCCDRIRATVREERIDAEYRQDGYLVMAIDAAEAEEIRASHEILLEMGYPSRLLSEQELRDLGFRAVHGGRYCQSSAQIHPVKFRNGLLRAAEARGTSYYSGIRVKNIDSDEAGVTLRVDTLGEGRPGEPVSEGHSGELRFDAVVIAANAYSPLLSEFFEARHLVEPFKGQIITSKPQKSKLPVSYPHSFDHGYEYALASQDNRLIIGGWRNNVPSREVGTYDLTPNPMVSEGLKEFVARHYSFDEELEWDYEWAGIMATSKTGLPFIGPTSSPLVFTCAGYTGHGLSWAHGSAALLADIIVGKAKDPAAYLFRPE